MKKIALGVTEQGWLAGIFSIAANVIAALRSGGFENLNFKYRTNDK